MKRVVCVLGFALYFISLNAQVPAEKRYADYQKLENNSYLKYLKKGKGTTRGEIGGALFIKLLFLTETDSVFIDVNAETQTPSYPMRLDTPEYQSDFLDIMSGLHVGDSVKFFMSLDSLKKYFPEEFVFDDYHDKMKYLGMAVSIDSIYTQEKTLRLQAEAEKKRTEQRLSDSVALQKYLHQNGLPATPNLNGMWYKETKQGSGSMVASGDSLTVHYRDSYATGQIANDDPQGDTFTYKFGVDEMRDGWDVGMAQMKVGGKAIFIILPDPDDIDGRILIYEVELLSLKHN
jgi:FKBP-type peptidyl-prolyl cis-trans isomerase